MIDGVVPERIEQPVTAEACAQLLHQASNAGWPTVIRGGGTKLGWGRRPTRVGLLLHTSALNRVVEHRHGDLIATVEAGARIHDVNAALARHGQWLPIDAPEDATVGGTLATNASGPLRHRYGTPRDLLIGTTLATTDGSLVRSGGQVVKNVAGYDLGKLVCGSHGTLAVIVSATFKLVPLLPAARTLIARFDDPSIASKVVAEISGSTLEPVAFDLRKDIETNGAIELLVRFASTAHAVDAQIVCAERMCGGAQHTVVEGPADVTLWRDQEKRAWNGAGAVVRLGWLPSNTAALIEFVRALESTESTRISLVGRAGVGAGYLRIDGSVDAQASGIARLRDAPAIARHVVIIRGDESLKSRVDVWPANDGALVPLRALKQQFDPAGILNAGRGLV